MRPAARSRRGSTCCAPKPAASPPSADWSLFVSARRGEEQRMRTIRDLRFPLLTLAMLIAGAAAVPRQAAAVPVTMGTPSGPAGQAVAPAVHTPALTGP